MTRVSQILTRAADLTQLAERVERAEGPDRELDCAIIKARYGVNPYPISENLRGPDGTEYYLDNGPIEFVPHFTASLDAALSLVPVRHSWAGGSCGEEQIPWACVTQNEAPCRDFSSDAATPTLALTAACLKAHATEADHA